MAYSKLAAYSKPSAFSEKERAELAATFADPTPPLKSLLAKYRRRERRENKAAADTFIRAAETNDRDLLAAALGELEFKSDAWKQILRQDCTIHPEFRSLFLFVWEQSGDAFRNMIDNDLMLLDLLRRFLPPYTGPAVELFRGETMFNRRRRTYGMSWSADRSAAECFATNNVRKTCIGGSVLLQTTASAGAVICAPHLIGASRPAEAEYIVDRRRLGAVVVVRRYAQLPMDS